MDNWIWGLSLIALTLAIHATAVAFMVWALQVFRVRLQTLEYRLPACVRNRHWRYHRNGTAAGTTKSKHQMAGSVRFGSINTSTHRRTP